MALVRVLLFAALAAIVVALFLYALKRDRRYLRFVGQVGKFTIAVLLATGGDPGPPAGPPR